MDVGDLDGLRIDAGKLHGILDTYGITNSFEIYSGTHTGAPDRPLSASRDAVLQQELML